MKQDTAALVGSRCTDCDVVVYPPGAICPACGAAMAPLELSRSGTVWTWTVQRYAPKSPPYVAAEPYVPFAVGYVELPEDVRVEAVIQADPVDAIEIGMSVELTDAATVPRFTVVSDHTGPERSQS